MCSLIEAFANQTWCQFVQRWTVVSGLRSCYRRMPSSLRTTRTKTAPTTRRKGTRSFPGLHAVDDICPGILAGVCIRYMRVRMPVAHKGEWRPKQRRRAHEQNNKSRRRGRIRKNNIEILYLYMYIILLNSYSIPKKVRAPSENGSNSQKKVP